METSDKQNFKRLFKSVAEYYDGKMHGPDIWWSALRSHSFESVRKAFSEHMTDPASGKFAPKASDVIGRIHAEDGHPGAEEAWAAVGHAIGDESTTLVMTTVMREAFLAADCNANDKIAARMTFKEVYNHRLSLARKNGEALEWCAILGHNTAQRDEVITNAVTEGKLLPQQARILLSHSSAPLTISDLVTLAPATVRKALSDMREKLTVSKV